MYVIIIIIIIITIVIIIIIIIVTIIIQGYRWFLIMTCFGSLSSLLRPKPRKFLKTFILTLKLSSKCGILASNLSFSQLAVSA